MIPFDKINSNRHDEQYAEILKALRIFVKNFYTLKKLKLCIQKN